MRRVTTALVASALTFAGMAAVAPSAWADITPEPLRITVTNLGPEHRTCHIDADLYVPTGVDSAHRAPAILATNGFGGTKKDQANMAQGMGEHGYVTLSYTGLGFVDGDQCPITLDDVEHDGAAASQLIRFLGGDPSIYAEDQNTHQQVHVDQVTQDNAATYDPAVGMVGGSYGGQIQFATAAYEDQFGAKRLDAIVPIITWNDLAYSLDPNNWGITANSGSLQTPNAGVFKYQWSLLFTAVGIADGVQDMPKATTFQDFQNLVTNNCANFDQPVCKALLEVSTQGYPSQQSIDFLRSNSVASYIKHIKIPTFLAQGQADTLFNLQESVATYRKLQQQNTPVKLEWQSWGHSGSTPVPGELDQRHPDSSYQGQQLVQWFDHYVKRDPNTAAPPLDFSYFRDWAYNGTDAAAVAAAYATAPSYPVGTQKTWYLSGSDVGGATVNGVSTGGGKLVDSQSQVTFGASAYSSTGAPSGPNYTETSALDQSKPIQDPPGTSIRFLTDPLAAPLDVVGSPKVTVRLQSPTALTQGSGPAGQLVVYAKLYDVGPTGAVELPHRLIAPARVADVTKPVTIELPGIVHRFQAGHRLAIVLAGGDMAYRGSNTPQPVALVTAPEIRQTFTVPVVG